MSGSSAGSFADRVARQLGLDAAGVAGSGPDGAATLTDVLREAGRRPPAAARPPPPRTVFSGDADADSDGETGEGTLRMEITCDARAVRETCGALAAVAAEPPKAVDVVLRLCAAARRDSPGLAGGDLVVRFADAPDTVLPGAPAGEEDRPARAALAVAFQAESIRLGIELRADAGEEGTAFLDRLRSLCLDPRRALL